MRAHLHIAAYLVSLSAYCVAADAMVWKQLTTSAPWSARSDTCAAVLGDRLVIAGGHANSNYTNDVWQTTDGFTWELVMEHAPWPARSYHSCVVLPGDRMVLLGGHAGKEWFNDVWISGPGGDVTVWTLVTPHAAFTPRAAGSLVFQGSSSQLFYFGGSNGLLPPVGFHTDLYNDVWVSSDEGATWKVATKAAPWKPREGITGGTGITVGDSMVVMGGEAGYFPWTFFSDIWSSEDGSSWIERASKASWTGFSAKKVWNLKGRSGHIVTKQAMKDGSFTLWLAGGYLGEQDVWCLSGVRSAADLSRSWTRVTGQAPWHGRFDHILVMFKGKLLLLGGENSAFGVGGPYFNDVWESAVPECSSGSSVLV